MKLTVKINKIKEPKGATKAFASVTIEDAYVITGLTVVEGKNGAFVQMPQKKVGEEYKDTFFPVTKEARQELSDAVLAAYAAVED